MPEGPVCARGVSTRTHSRIAVARRRPALPRLRGDVIRPPFLLVDRCAAACKSLSSVRVAGPTVPPGYRGGARDGHYNDGVLALRYVYVLALAVWLGGMVVLGAVVAPTTFQVLQASEPATGRLLGGAVFGAVLARFHYVAYGAGIVALVALAAMALLGPRPHGFAVRSSIVGAMLLVALYSGSAVLREVDAIQTEVGGLPSSLPSGDARRVRFDELHQRSTQLMVLNIVGALVLLYWEARER